MATDACHTLVYSDDVSEQPNIQEFQRALERGPDDRRVDTMKRLLVIMLNGDPMEKLLVHVIRFVLPCKDKRLKKLLQFYWEICPKRNADGKLMQEFILVCNALRNDLQHPNEYIRGSTLRFLCKIKEEDVLEPLVPSVRACLEHRHAFVRKNAVFAFGSIYKFASHLCPDAPEVIQQFLDKEGDTTCQRNAFVVLGKTNPQLAVNYILEHIQELPVSDELLQLAVIDFIRRDSTSNVSAKGAYTRCASELLSSTSSVKYEAANVLMSLTSNLVAAKAVMTCYIDLIVNMSDNNVKLIVLDRLEDIRSKHEHELDDFAMDILRVLNCPALEVRRKALNIVLEMVSSRNIKDIIFFLQRELSKTLEQEYDKNSEYRQLLIQSIHYCAIKFPNVAADVIYILMEFLGDSSNPAAVDTIAFVREVVEKLPNLRGAVVKRLLETFADVKSGKVFRGALWIVGEYCLSLEEINEAWEELRQAIGEVPILAAEQRQLEAEDEGKEGDETKASGASLTRRVLPDGTYATESAFVSSGPSATGSSATKPPLRALILNGDYFLGTVLATTLTKLVLRYSTLVSDASSVNARKAEAMLIMTSIIRVGQSQFSASPIDEDSYDRILQDLRVVGSQQDEVADDVYLKETRAVFAKQVQDEENRLADVTAKNKQTAVIQVDEPILFRQFANKLAEENTNEYEQDLSRATGDVESKDNLMSKLNRIVQLTGFSDPVYAEAVVNVHQYDILMDVLIVNQTTETLQNLTVEFATLGDLKLVDRPTSHNLGPHSFMTIKAPIKVSSTESGVIFGNIVYDSHSASESNCVVLNDIHIDIMDYINPATCTEVQFRSMWTEFEWENKVNVNTNIRQVDLRKYLEHIMSSTNMGCLTPEKQLEGDCGFLSANLCARSIFGEDALANVSIEKAGDAPISGHIRIRSKTQGIALSLGDKITSAQKIAAA